MNVPCPVCRSPLDWQQGRALSSISVQCPRCGRFDIGDLAAAQFERATNLQRAVLSYAIRRQQWPSRLTPQVSPDDIKRILETERLPTPPEQANNLIILLGKRQPSSVEPFSLSRYQLDGELGAAIADDLEPIGWRYIVDFLIRQNLIDVRSGNSDQTISLMLTIPGWSRFDELLRTTSDSRKAFMAMKFRDPDLDRIFREDLIPAVAQTGFQLERLDMNPKPGLIDARMEVEIRAARFVVADLTDGNCGAYWEAGFAAGLGKPVFYTCEKTYFERPGSHFDTNHHYTVLWDPASPGPAMEELKASIRRTFPADSKLYDD